MKNFRFLGIIAALMLVVGMSFCACSSDDDEEEQSGVNSGAGGNGSGGGSASISLQGTWKLVKVVQTNSNGESVEIDYSAIEPDEDINNYMRITATEWYLSFDAGFTECVVFDYSAADGQARLYNPRENGESYDYEGICFYRFEGSQLVLFEDYEEEDFSATLYYSRMN